MKALFLKLMIGSWATCAFANIPFQPKTHLSMRVASTFAGFFSVARDEEQYRMGFQPPKTTLDQHFEALRFSNIMTDDQTELQACLDLFIELKPRIMNYVDSPHFKKEKMVEWLAFVRDQTVNYKVSLVLSRVNHLNRTDTVSGAPLVKNLSERLSGIRSAFVALTDPCYEGLK